MCIPRIYTCDGEVDCFGEEGVSSDEMDCGKSNQFNSV